MRGRFSQLDGLRGWAALAVVFGHFLGGFYPKWGDEPVHPPFWQWLLDRSFIQLFLANGDFSVAVFFVLSGFVLSYSAFNKGNYDTTRAVARRYFRLAIPVVCSVALVYIAMRIGGIFNHQAAMVSGSGWLDGFLRFNPHVFGAAYQSFITVFSSAPDPITWYNPVLWTMKIELIGSMLVFGFMRMFGGQRYRVSAYLILGVLLVQSWYVMFVVGMLLADLCAAGKLAQWSRRAVWLSTLALGVVLELTYLMLSKWAAYGPAFIHGPLLYLSASLMVLVALTNGWAIRLLSARVSRFVGRISYAVYLNHFVVLVTVASYLYVSLRVSHGDRLALPLVGIVLMVVTIALSYLFTRYVDEPAIVYARRIGDGLISGSVFRASQSLVSRVRHFRRSGRKELVTSD